MDALFSPCVKRQLAIPELFGGIWQEKNGTGSTGKTNGETGSTTTTSTGTGTCGGTSTGGTTTPTIPSSGNFGQITDGSYADKLTMQYYKDGNVEINPFYSETSAIAQTHDSEMNGNYSFSKSGCLMTCTAKVISEKSGKQIYLRDINKHVDKNSDGLLSFEEIEAGIEYYLGKEYNIESNWYQDSLNAERFIEASNRGDTYVLARACGDFDGNGTEEHHWVVLEGFTTDSNGRLVFTYDGSSNNDVGRSYVFGNADNSKNEFKIDKIATFTITRK